MRISEDILQLVPDDELIALRDCYGELKRVPYVCNFIDTAIRWKKQRPDKNFVTFFAPHGNWKRDGTFVALLQWSCYDLMVFTLDPSCERLYEALTRTKRFDWSNRWFFYGIDALHLKTVVKALKDINVTISHSIVTNMWMITKEKALEFKIECPSEVYVKKLEVSHAPILNKVWPHKYPGSTGYIETFIKMNGGYGLFLKSDNSIVAWVLKNHLGALAILQTVEEHKRKGYGSLITKVLSQEIAKEGHEPIAMVLIENVTSQKLFKNLGFQIISGVTNLM